MRNERGFTLSEVVTSLGVFAVLVLIASALSSWAIYRYYSIRDRLIAESMGFQAETIFKNTFGQALDIEFLDSSLPTSVTEPSPTGRIYSNIGSTGFLFDQMGDSATWQNIAIFYRENGTGLRAGTGAVRGAPSPTFVYYRRPSPTTSGVIFFNLSTPPTNGAFISPDYSDLFIDRVSTFGITKYRHAIYDKVTNIEVLLRIRYHMFTGSGRNWCPQRDIQNGAGGCGLMSNWKDLEKRFTVTLKNGLMKPAGMTSPGQPYVVSGDERTLGNLYFFRLVSPMRYQ